MKRIIALLCLAVLMVGCTGKSDELDRAMALRAKMLTQSIRFEADITADYGDKIFQFSVECQANDQGAMTFTVIQPQTIAGVSGKIDSSGGKLTFDDKALSFPLMADEQITPVSGPWVLIKTLRSGYLTSCGRDGEKIRVAIDDSYADDALHLDIWLGEGDLPVRGEILWQGRRILTIDVKNFCFV